MSITDILPSIRKTRTYQERSASRSASSISDCNLSSIAQLFPSTSPSPLCLSESSSWKLDTYKHSETWRWIKTQKISHLALLHNPSQICFSSTTWFHTLTNVQEAKIMWVVFQVSTKGPWVECPVWARKRSWWDRPDITLLEILGVDSRDEEGPLARMGAGDGDTISHGEGDDPARPNSTKEGSTDKPVIIKRKHNCKTIFIYWWGGSEVESL